MARVPRTDLGILRLHDPILACSLIGGGGGRRRLLVDSSASAERTWRKPEAGWMKLNFDGSSKDLTGIASIGGVYRDHEGAFVLGYAERIGAVTSFAAELAALRRGLELAVRYGWRRVWAEGDSRAVVDVVRGRIEVRSGEVLRRCCREIAALLPLLDSRWRMASPNLATRRGADGCGTPRRPTRCSGSYSVTLIADLWPHHRPLSFLHLASEGLTEEVGGGSAGAGSSGHGPPTSSDSMSPHLLGVLDTILTFGSL
ncbi:hypothetical protein E2562_030676 [Oryza meyeriana var. granulata]|uniref:RNase H type-1 domain-containing protein n=1 Tax=Oryza meyeriana var. granulata TaxID=110450 RepID=A0A6G1DQ28_9ORYZ|nr:hypothetical protein E2562_030676 [Oryza meyeriana var. granulata]